MLSKDLKPEEKASKKLLGDLMATNAIRVLLDLDYTAEEVEYAFKKIEAEEIKAKYGDS